VKPYYQDDAVVLYCADCREIVPTLVRFDLLLTDPPYGIGVDRTMAKQGGTQYGNAAAAKRHYEASGWDDATPPRWLLDMLRDHAEKSIVWGGNYFELPPARGWLVWDKMNGDNAFADCELAWTSMDIAVRKREHLWNGMLRAGKEERCHPTQKPIGLLRWCIVLAGDVQTILDPFAGSGTTGVAAKQLGRKCTLIEREERYCEIIVKRLAQEYLPLEMPPQVVKEKREATLL
jgi:DNA modification methylase